MISFQDMYIFIRLQTESINVRLFGAHHWLVKRFPVSSVSFETVIDWLEKKKKKKKKKHLILSHTIGWNEKRVFRKKNTWNGEKKTTTRKRNETEMRFRTK